MTNISHALLPRTQPNLMTRMHFRRLLNQQCWDICHSVHSWLIVFHTTSKIATKKLQWTTPGVESTVLVEQKKIQCYASQHWSYPLPDQLLCVSDLSLGFHGREERRTFASYCFIRLLGRHCLKSLKNQKNSICRDSNYSCGCFLYWQNTLAHMWRQWHFELVRKGNSPAIMKTILKRICIMGRWVITR